MTVLTKSGSDAASGSESSGGRKVPIAIAMVAASLPMFMATLDNLVMTSALPVIEKELNASVGQLQWFMNAYTLCFATLMLSATTLGDRWGRRKMFVFGIGLFTAASIASALSTTPSLLIAARAFQAPALPRSCRSHSLSSWQRYRKPSVPWQSACGVASPAWGSRWGPWSVER